MQLLDSGCEFRAAVYGLCDAGSERGMQKMHCLQRCVQCNQCLSSSLVSVAGRPPAAGRQLPVGPGAPGGLSGVTQTSGRQDPDQKEEE